METWAQHNSISALTYFAQLPWSTSVDGPEKPFQSICATRISLRRSSLTQLGSSLLPNCHGATYWCFWILNYGTMIIRTVSVTAVPPDDEPAITTIGSPDLAKPVSFSWVTA
jgi:hypothetical protein